MLDESSEPLRTVTLRMYPGGPASPVSTTGLWEPGIGRGWPGCRGLDGWLGGLILMVCVLGCSGWLGLWVCLGLLGGGGMMRGMWICFILGLVWVESGTGAGLSGLKVIPWKAKVKKKEHQQNFPSSLKPEKLLVISSKPFKLWTGKCCDFNHTSL